MLAIPGSRRGLFPAPTALDAQEIWIVEGQPDALAANSAGLPAVGISGVWGWRPEWTRHFKDRDVVICADADSDGRAAAHRIGGDLLGVARSV